MKKKGEKMGLIVEFVHYTDFLASVMQGSEPIDAPQQWWRLEFFKGLIL